MQKRTVAIAAVFTTITVTAAPPTQTAYRCNDQGKTVYTDTPCLDGRQVDTTPTRGMNKSTGTVLKGRDVTIEEHREGIARALAPITGQKSAEVLYRDHDRSKRLTQRTFEECRSLDASMPTLHEQRDAAEFYRQRLRFKTLGC